MCVERPSNAATASCRTLKNNFESAVDPVSAEAHLTVNGRDTCFDDVSIWKAK
jgi:hypothetical protein